MITTADFKKGAQVELDGEPDVIVTTKSQTPSARGVTTAATTDTGLELQVPLYVKPGLRIRVATADGSFGGRAE